MEAQNEGWLLHFKNGSSFFADMVIAADGANSKIRPYITHIKAFYSGITMLEGNIYEAEKAAPYMNRFLNGGKIMAFGNSKDLFVGQKGNGDIGFGASFKTDENWATNNGLNFADKKQVLNWFKTAYTGWSSTWYELFESATTPFIPRPIYCMPLDQTWETLPNLTMLGDAAHVMPPFAGEGANVAMLDALELSEHLTSGKYHTLKEAITPFETDMRKRAVVAAAESLENGERMHSEGALKIMLEFFSGH
jgi:2-polyprenyl-6-methoxyphenol hydroxylase-like FAD-dependent oxidoreductase